MNARTSLFQSRINFIKLRRFVLSRQNEDGGFAFCRPLPSSLPETFYAVYILKAVGEEIPNREKLMNFLRKNIRKELYSIFWIFRSLSLLEEELPDLSDFLLNKLESAVNRGVSRSIVSETGNTATYTFEGPNVLREIYLLSTSLRLLRVKIPDFVIEFIKKFRKNGGFGITAPNLQETYFCVSVLEDVENRDDVISYIRQHESRGGGFSKIPHGHPPYIEDTFYSLSSLSLLHHIYKSEKTLEYICSLQNSNGGFRRSIYGGISTLENTYYALACLEYLSVP